MEFIQDKDGIRIWGIDKNEYEKTRKRLTTFTRNKYISDKDIIELLTEEIKQYREKIHKQEEFIKQFHKENKTHEIDTERNIFSCGIDGGVRDYSVTSYYKNGQLIKERIEPVNKN